MKIIYKPLLLIVLGLTFGACEDLLDTTPTDRISTEIFWKTEKDAQLAANAVYTHLTETATHYASWDGMTDIGYTNLPQSPESFILQGTFDQLNSRVASDWKGYYSGIRSANAFLDNVDKVQTSNTALINRLKGEVRTLRANYYISLAFLYGDVPLLTSEVTLEESKVLTRTPVSQVWDFISSELTEAATLLPNTQTEKGRITKGTALALKARAALYAKRYQEAADAAKAVMDLNVYSIIPSYKDLFTYNGENNAEVILDIQFIKGTLPNDVFSVLAQRSVNGKNLFVPTKVLVDSYEMTNGLPIGDAASGFDPMNPYAGRDPRLKYSVYVEGDILPNGKVFDPKPSSTTGDAVGSTFLVSPTGYNVKKYISAEDLAAPTNAGINFILLRYAEVKLIYAEAKIAQNQIDQSVYDAINSVRQRTDVNMPAIASGKSQEEMTAIVRHERMVELAFEGQRFFDIRRWEIAGDVMPGKVYGMTYKNAQGNLQTVEVPAWTNTWNDRNYLWPVPQQERDLNDQLGQNPNW
ncbi:RagB/SusD family nutrient uptake outer membrane protein [Chryseolinea sp. T2]|uniref:RagB/SusD family nutrient uptake outer membrane protein n=1 Tax=Chryseolinea sp. T2 TaxID=3129255 RepID=UPI00307809A1